VFTLHKSIFFVYYYNCILCISINRQLFADNLLCVLWFDQALYASKIISYAQGFMLMRETAQQFGWKLNFGGIALMWRGGCIIRRLVRKFTLHVLTFDF